MRKVQSVNEENLLLIAYRTVMTSEKVDPASLVAEYERHFSSVVQQSSTKKHVFERFSMADSNICVTVKSNTAIV